MKRGRPTLYRPEHCETVIELGKQGLSPAQIAGKLGVARVSLSDWAKRHPEFSAALTRAKTLEQKWWEDAGQAALHADRFRADVWIRSMQSRFRDDYCQRRTQAIGSDKPLEPVRATSARIDLDRLSPQDRTLVEAILKRQDLAQK